METLEHVLIALDSWPWSAVWRVAIGLAIAPVFHTLSGGGDSVLIAFILFLGLLVVMRAAPAAVRHALPFSDKAKEIWKARRNIAKVHDSYQWQKLFWVGLGLLAYAVVGDGWSNSELAVTLFCLIGGVAGLLVWSRVNNASIAADPATR